MFRFTLIYVHKFLENAPVQVLTQLCHCQIFSQIRITHKSCFCIIFLIYFFIYFLYISLYISYTFLYIFLIHFFIYFLYISLFDIIYKSIWFPMTHFPSGASMSRGIDLRFQKFVKASSTKVYLKFFQTSMVELFVKMIND